MNDIKNIIHHRKALIKPPGTSSYVELAPWTGGNRGLSLSIPAPLPTLAAVGTTHLEQVDRGLPQGIVVFVVFSALGFSLWSRFSEESLMMQETEYKQSGWLHWGKNCTRSRHTWRPGFLPFPTFYVCVNACVCVFVCVCACVCVCVFACASVLVMHWYMTAPSATFLYTWFYKPIDVLHACSLEVLYASTTDVTPIWDSLMAI